LELDSVDTLRMYHETARVFGWLGRGGEIRYPSWQIHANRLLPGLADVLAVLNEKAISPLSIIGYYLTPRYSLQDARPLDLLRKGEAQLVVEDSKRCGDIGT